MSIRDNLDFTFVRGDSFAIPVTMSNTSGDSPVPIDLSAATITSDIKLNVNSSTPTLSFTVTMTDAVNGQFTLSLAATDTATMKPTLDDGSNVYYYDCQFDYSSDGSNVKTEFGGTLTILQEVTV